MEHTSIIYKKKTIFLSNFHFMLLVFVLIAVMMSMSVSGIMKIMYQVFSVVMETLLHLILVRPFFNVRNNS